MDVSEKKAALRKEIRAARRALSEEERTAAAALIADKLIRVKGIAEAGTILAYMPMKYELDILPAVSLLRARGKRIAFPLCIENGGLRLFVPADENGFVKGAYGILEPDVNTAEEIGGDELDAIILPAIGFDEKLNRLGQGGGYYDRLLSKTRCYKIAVGFDCQLVGSVPVEEFDKPVDAVATPSRVILRDQSF